MGAWLCGATVLSDDRRFGIEGTLNFMFSQIDVPCQLPCTEITVSPPRVLSPTSILEEWKNSRPNLSWCDHALVRDTINVLNAFPSTSGLRERQLAGILSSLVSRGISLVPPVTGKTPLSAIDWDRIVVASHANTPSLCY